MQVIQRRCWPRLLRSSIALRNSPDLSLFIYHNRTLISFYTPYPPITRIEFITAIYTKRAGFPKNSPSCHADLTTHPGKLIAAINRDEKFSRSHIGDLPDRFPARFARIRVKFSFGK